MKKEKQNLNKKITFVTAVALTALSAGWASQRTVKAAEVDPNASNGTQNNAVVNQAQQNRVTDQDVQNAQNDVTKAQGQVDTAKQDLQQAQTNVNNAQSDLQQAQANKPVINTGSDEQTQQAVEKAQQDVNQKQQAVNTAQGQVTQAQQDVTQKQEQAKVAQTNNTQAQQAAQNAQKHIQDAQSMVDHTQQEVEKSKEINTSKLTASQSYINAVKKYNDAYVEQVQKGLQDHDQKEINDATNYGMNAKDFKSDMQKASDESYNLSSNKFVHNDYDKSRKANINNLTDDEQRELSDFAVGLMNDMNRQVGLSEFSVNSDVQKMADDIAKGYIEDNRSLFDGKSHDYDRINQVSKDYGLQSTTGKSQYYENAAGWVIGVRHVDGTNSDESVWYTNNNNSGETNMDEIKAGLYNSLKVMYFNHDEWFHAYGLLKAADYNSNVYPDKQIKYHFAYIPSALPGSNEVTDHFIIVADSNEQSNSKINNSNDHTVGDINNRIQKAKQARNMLKEDQNNLEQAKQQAQDAAETEQQAQENLDKATKLVQNAQRIARVAQGNLQTAKQDLAKSQENLQKLLDAQKGSQHYTEAQKQKLAEYEKSVAEKQSKLESAKKDLSEKQDALQKAEKNLSNKQSKLKQIEAIKKAQDLADQTAKENQGKSNQGKGDSGKQNTGNKGTDKGNQGTQDPNNQGKHDSDNTETKPNNPSSTTDNKGNQGNTDNNGNKSDSGKTNTNQPENPDVNPSKPNQGNKGNQSNKNNNGSTSVDSDKPVDNLSVPVIPSDVNGNSSTPKVFVKSIPTDNLVGSVVPITPTNNLKLPLATVHTVTVRHSHKQHGVLIVGHLKNGKFVLYNTRNGKKHRITREFANMNDLMQYLRRNYNGKNIKIRLNVTLTRSKYAYLRSGNKFSKTSIVLHKNKKIRITEMRVSGKHVFGRVGNTKLWVLMNARG